MGEYIGLFACLAIGVAAIALWLANRQSPAEKLTKTHLNSEKEIHS